MLVFPNSQSTTWVPVRIGTEVIDKIIETITEEELTQASETLKKTHMSTVLVRQIVQGQDDLMLCPLVAH